LLFLLFTTTHLTWYTQTHYEISFHSDQDIPELPTAVTSICKCCCRAWCAIWSISPTYILFYVLRRKKNNLILHHALRARVS